MKIFLTIALLATVGQGLVWIVRAWERRQTALLQRDETLPKCATADIHPDLVLEGSPTLFRNSAPPEKPVQKPQPGTPSTFQYPSNPCRRQRSESRVVLSRVHDRMISRGGAESAELGSLPSWSRPGTDVSVNQETQEVLY
jgi:hypothetical protein